MTNNKWLLEEWRPVVGYEGLYEVSNCGRVKSCEKVVWNNYGVGHWHKYKEKVMKLSLVKNRYSAQLSKNGEYEYPQVSRLVAKAFPEICGEWFEGCVVHHIDHNTKNNNASNLVVMPAEEHKKLHSESEITNELKRTSKKSMKHLLQLKNGVPYFIWKSIQEAADIGGFTYRAIEHCLTGDYSNHKGYQWELF